MWGLKFSVALTWNFRSLNRANFKPFRYRVTVSLLELLEIYTVFTASCVLFKLKWWMTIVVEAIMCTTKLKIHSHYLLRKSTSFLRNSNNVCFYTFSKLIRIIRVYSEATLKLVFRNNNEILIWCEGIKLDVSYSQSS